MTDKINFNRRAQRTGKSSAGRRRGTTELRSADAARFLYKAQCYDAGPESETKCGLCGGQIQLCYVLKVLQSTDPLSAEIGKLTIGECCFKPIKGVNEKLYSQLLAAAINLRTFVEAIQRDQRIFAGIVPESGCSPLPLDADEEMVSRMFEQIIAQGGEHV
jgi:hypothetical protein